MTRGRRTARPPTPGPRARARRRAPTDLPFTFADRRARRGARAPSAPSPTGCATTGSPRSARVRGAAGRDATSSTRRTWTCAPPRSRAPGRTPDRRRAARDRRRRAARRRRRPASSCARTASPARSLDPTAAAAGVRLETLGRARRHATTALARALLEGGAAPARRREARRALARRSGARASVVARPGRRPPRAADRRSAGRLGAAARPSSGARSSSSGTAPRPRSSRSSSPSDAVRAPAPPGAPRRRPRRSASARTRGSPWPASRSCGPDHVVVPAAPRRHRRGRGPALGARPARRSRSSAPASTTVLEGDRSTVEQVEIVFGGEDQLFDLTSYTRHVGRDTTGQPAVQGRAAGPGPHVHEGPDRDREDGDRHGQLPRRVRDEPVEGGARRWRSRRSRSTSRTAGGRCTARRSARSTRASCSTSRAAGIPPDDARKFIVLGFLEPVVARVPLEEAQDRLRDALEAKWDAGLAPTGSATAA